MGFEFIFLICLGLCSPVLGNISIFLLAGQSNMVGRGGVDGKWDGKVPPESHPNPLILRLNNDLSWEEAHEPLHQNISTPPGTGSNRPCGIGPGMPFANSLLKIDPTVQTIGLVPCAVGDTSITEWSRGSCLYARLLTRARAAVNNGGVLRGILWYQGEKDASNVEDAEQYKWRLMKFFTDIRFDLQSPLLPVMQVALASGGMYIEEVREAQVTTELLNVECVDAKGLALEGDNLHLTSAAQVHLGAMLADAYLRWFNKALSP